MDELYMNYISIKPFKQTRETSRGFPVHTVPLHSFTPTHALSLNFLAFALVVSTWNILPQII